MFASKDVSIGQRAAYPIARSVRLRASATAYLSRTPASASNRTTWTWSSWVKFGLLTGSQTLFEAQNGTTFSRILIDGNLNFSCQGGTSNVSTTFNVATSAVIRDPSSWYHLVISFDTTQATAANRVRVYINGVQITAFATATYPTQNSTWSWNAACLHNIGRYVDSTFGAGGYADGYLAEMNFVDGQALTPSSFGAFNIYGVWQPAKYQGTYGTNGFYLNFKSFGTAAALGTDSSGNSNTWTVTNISVSAGATYDAMQDTPTLTSLSAANYATGNPVFAYTYAQTFTNGNLRFTNTSPASYYSSIATIGMTTGKWYAEFTIVTQKTSATPSQTWPAIGVGQYTSADVLVGALGWGYGGNGNKLNNSTQTAFGATLTAGDVVQVALDVDAGKVWFGKNGTWQASGDPSAGTNPAFSGLNATNYTFFSQGFNGSVSDANFGQQPWSYTPPTGFNALNTFNLANPAIPNGAAQMAATLYTGNNSALVVTNTVNGTSMQPDLVWLKTRSGGGTHVLYDSVRGNTLFINSNTTAADTTQGAGTGLTSFNSNGFTLAADILVGAGTTNSNGITFVGWQWKAGTGLSINTSGSIASTVNASTSSGFSIVTYTGTGAVATVGHGLSAVPSLIIVKGRTTAGDPWAVYSSSLANTQYLYLNTTAAVATGVNLWNSTTPTSSVFTIGAAQDTNRSAGGLVAYCFAPVAGYSAFGSYTGNGSADGPFVYLGFRPRFTLIKRTDAIANWRIHDTARDTYNVASNTLYPNLLNAETSAASEYWDILSNGIKLRTSDAESNASGGTYIYMCFAENPFKYALAR